MKEQLKELGLNNYEANVYEVLIRHGTLTAKEISIQSRVPLGRIFDTLKSLVDKELILIIKGRPMFFRAIEPKIGLKNLFNKKVKNMKNTEKEVFSVLKKIKKRKPRTKMIEKVNIFCGHDLLWKTVKKTLNNAEHSVKIIATYEERPYGIMKLFYKLVKMGINIKIITTKLTDKGLALIKKDIKNGVKIKYYPIEELRFTIVDGKETLQTIINPRNKSDRITMQIKSKQLSHALDDYFDKIWRKASKIK